MTTPPFAAGLRLLITHCQGHALDAVWTWPTGREQVSLQEVLACWVDAAEPWLEEAQKVFLHQESPEVWSLRQSSQLLLCSCNGQLLRVAETVLLHHNDALELGMCHLQVKTEPDKAPGVATALVPDFEWDQLRSRHATHQVDLVQDAVAADEVLHLLHDALEDAKPQVPSATGVSAAPDASAQQSAPEVLKAPLTDADQTMQGLHAQYLQKLTDPFGQADLSTWQTMAARPSGQVIDPFQDILDQAEQGPTMPQLLGQSVHIQSVLNQLDTLGSSDILSPDAHINVMRLFAPVGLREEPMHQVPSLNRQEHHGMALDSAMQGTSARHENPDNALKNWNSHD